MACNLTQNLSIDCKDSVGGLKEVLFIEFENVLTITAPSGVVTAMTLVTGKQFRRYIMPKETAFFTEAPTVSVQNGTIFYQQELTIVINKSQANTRNELQVLAQNRLIALCLDLNGKYWLLGWEQAIDVTGGEGGSGTAHGDRNGYTRSFTGMERVMAPEVLASLIPALIVPAT